jgi:hypothetical protein
MQEIIRLSTRVREELVDITTQVSDLVERSVSVTAL